MFDINPATGSREVTLHTDGLFGMGDDAASLAHRVKQPIAAAALDAGACLRWLLNDPPDLQRAREAAGRILSAAKRAADMIDGEFPLPEGEV
ncbi:MAG TPA: hypothetical protein VMT20_09045 [Terriglobia bacterium]|jgi:hypothetical protein|nr:hypothetical protein [Terriglobia bacterium]